MDRLLMMKLPPLEDEAARLEALFQYEILDTPPEEAFDRMTRLAAKICEVPISSISLIDQSRQWIKSKVGWEVTEILRDLSFCAHAILQHDLLVIPDLLEDERFSKNPFVTQPPHLRFYAGIPLVTSEGFAIGTLSVLGPLPKALEANQVKALKALSHQVMAQLDVRRKASDFSFQRRKEKEALFLLASIVDSSEDAIIGLSLDGQILHWNTGAEKIYGYTAKEVEGHPIAMLMPPDRPDEIGRILEKIKKGEKIRQSETEQIKKDLTQIEILLTFSPIQDAAGQVTAVSVIGRDISARKWANKQLQETKERFDMVVRATNDVIWDWDLISDGVWWNNSLQEAFHYSKDQIGPDVAWWVEHLHPEDRERVVAGIHLVIDQGGSSWSDEYRFLHSDGSYAVIYDRGHVVRDNAGKPIRMIGAMMDITQRKQAEGALHQSEAEKRALIDAIPDLLFRISKEGTFIDLKASRDFNLGILTHESIGKKIQDLFPKEVAEQTMHYVGRAFKTGGTQIFEYQLPTDDILRDYEARIVVSGNHEVLAIVREITERKAQASVLEYQALHDSLTDLPNRTLLHDRLQQAILSAQRQSRPLALLLMDLDRFKDVNDTLGHHFGDTLLQQVGQRLQGTLRESDTVARLGGDEFAILLSALADVSDVSLVAGKILHALEAPFILEGHILDIGASIGISLFPEHGAYADLLIQRADVAMYLAKQAGGGFAIYSAEQDQNSPRRLAMKGELRQAIENGDLFLLYQPKLDLQTSRVIGVEALVRWRHPRLGTIPPDQFITLAEHTGLIKPLTLWVLNAALSQCRLWCQAGLELRIAVNLSARNLQDQQISSQIANLLEARSVAPEMLELEITESVIMEDPARAMEILTRLSEMGIRLSIDDFGTGYSSLGYLKKLPVDEIKIDKSFVKEMATDGDDTVIVRSIIDLAHNLGLQVIAEGVEDEETWDALVILGCDAAQGYYMSRPIPADELTRWIGKSQEAKK